MKLTDTCKITRVKDSCSEGSTTVYGYGVSMLDETNSNSYFDADFFLLAGDYTSIELFAQGSDDNSTWHNLSGSGVEFVSGYGYSVGILSVINPEERYIRPGVLRDTATIDGIVCVQHGAKRCPITQDQSVEADHSVVNPGTGDI